MIALLVLVPLGVVAAGYVVWASAIRRGRLAEYSARVDGCCGDPGDCDEGCS